MIFNKQVFAMLRNSMFRSSVRAGMHLINRIEIAKANQAKEVIMSRQAAPNTYTKLYGTKIRETQLAIYFCVQKVAFIDAPDAFKRHEQDTFWFPISQLKSQMTPADPVELSMIEVADWICAQKGIISGE